MTGQTPKKRRRKSEQNWNYNTERLSRDVPLATALHKFFRSIGISERIDEQRAVFAWESVVGENIAGVTEALSISGGILKVKVNSPAWKTELSYLEPEIRIRLNQHLGTNVVNRIKFS